MLAKATDPLSRIDPLSKIEDSYELRGIVLISLLISLGLLATAEWELLGEPELLRRTLSLGLLFLPGYTYSYLMRYRSSWLVKLLLAVLMIGALLNFFRELAYSSFDPRIPLANLLIELQVLHSFDLPRRKDLLYSLLGSLTLFFVALVLSPSPKVIFLSPLWLLSFLSALFLMRETSQSSLPLSHLISRAMRSSLALWLISLTLFLVMPKPTTNRLVGFYLSPFLSVMKVRSSALRSRGSGNVQRGGIALPKGYQEGSVERVTLWQPYSPPEEKIIAKVKGYSNPYYKSIVYDHYDGREWIRLRKGILSEYGRNYAFTLSLPLSTPFSSREAYQYFIFLEDAPGVIINSLPPKQLFFPMENVYLDSNDNILTPAPIVKGMSYTLLGNVPSQPNLDISLRDYRALLQRRIDYVAPYLEVEKVSPQLLKLAMSLGEAKTLSELLNNVSAYFSGFKYNTNVSFNPDEDVISQFLERREGYCIHFATATTIILRLNGIPTRFVTGYLAEDYDPLSGYQLIKSTDGHAWVELIVPTESGGLTWYIFDTTPLALPPYEEVPKGLSPVLRWLERGLKGFSERLSARKVKLPWGEISLLSFTWDSAILLLALLALITLSSLLARKLKATLAYRKLKEALDLGVKEEKLLEKLFLIALEVLRERGYERKPWETLREYLQRLKNEEGVSGEEDLKVALSFLSSYYERIMKLRYRS